MQAADCCDDLALGIEARWARATERCRIMLFGYADLLSEEGAEPIWT